MKKVQLLLTIICLAAFSTMLFAQANFSTSLHKNRQGKNFWYGTANGGFETLTGVPIDGLGCVQCHGPHDADGNPFPDPYDPNCVDCHPSNSGFNPDSILVSQCYTCHGRQAAEANALGISDVHRDAGMKCWDCHNANDMHGNGTEYVSMLSDGAIEAECTNCHIDENSTPPLPDHSSYDPHGGKLHCTTCHAQTVLSCYNCHYESVVDHHIKRAKAKITGFVILVNREKDGKVYPATFQSLSYQGKTHVAFGPFTSHTITGAGRTCTDCHANMGGTIDAINDYNDDGVIQFASWNDADSSLSWTHGIVPMPADYTRSFKLDFITFNGDASTPPGTDNKNWSLVSTDWDQQQMFFATPLTKEQMAKLGMDTTLTTGVSDPGNAVPSDYVLEQNYPNPFNPVTTIKYAIPRSSHVSLKVFDTLGNLIETLVNTDKSAGNYTVQFDAAAVGRRISSGVYFYQLTTPEYSTTKKLVLMK